MPDFTIDLTNQPIPKEDGDVNVYIHTEAAKSKQYFQRGRQVIFVNGMLNSGEDHAESALALSLVQMCPVVGVYNKSFGFWRDLGQCIADKNQFDGFSISAKNKAKKAAKKGLVPEKVILDELGRNKAQVELFKLLRDPKYKACDLFAHSQGNLILSNVLQGIAAVDGEGAVAGRVVHTFGSPAVNWPAGLKKFEHGFTFDPVNWLSGIDLSFSISKVGMPKGALNPITHGFVHYMNNDPEFVVNRFRTGSFGMTINMDEAGLADALAAMGPNMPRVGRIFRHLYDKHNSDSDDVAVLYVEKIKRSPSTVQALGADGALVQLLVDILDEGWTSREEQEAISWLRGLR